MIPNNFIDGNGFNQASELAWLMFLQSGEPGYYMLFNDLNYPIGKEDKTLE